jgi:hypothetical protein
MYIKFLSKLWEELTSSLPELNGHLVPLNAVIENVENEFVVRPAFNFGVDNIFSNLRNLEIDAVFTFQIFKAHDSNFSILNLSQEFKKVLNSLPCIQIDNAQFIIKNVNLILQNNPSDFQNVSVQISVNIF